MENFALTVVCHPLFDGEVNCYLIETTHFLILIDTSISGARTKIESALDRRIHSEKKLLILNTHGHWDHASLNGYLKEKYHGLILAHPKACLFENKAAQFQSIYGDFFRHHDGENNFRSFYEAEFEYPASPDVCLTGGEVIKDDCFSLIVLYTPGHSNDSLSFFDEHSGFLFSGDAIQGAEQFGNAPLYNDAASYSSSVQALCSLQPQKIFCGHRIITGQSSSHSFLESSLAAYSKIDNAVQHAMADGSLTKDTVELFSSHLTALPVPILSKIASRFTKFPSFSAALVILL